MSYDVDLRKQTKGAIKWGVIGFALLICLILAGMTGCPRYEVYSKGMEGKAKLEEARHSKLITIEDAKAKNQAAISQAEAKITMAKANNKSMVIKAQGQRQADSIRAIGVARANEIIGKSLKGNSDYLHFLWIDQLKDGNQKVYIPTESNLPILEARPD
jgi:vacuolar-type H+-ATPase subunit H